MASGVERWLAQVSDSELYAEIQRRGMVQVRFRPVDRHQQLLDAVATAGVTGVTMQAVGRRLTSAEMTPHYPTSTETNPHAEMARASEGHSDRHLRRRSRMRALTLFRTPDSVRTPARP